MIDIRSMIEEEMLIHVLTGEIKVERTELGCFVLYRGNKLLVISEIMDWLNAGRGPRYILNCLSSDMSLPGRQGTEDIEEFMCWIRKVNNRLIEWGGEELAI